jgi:hypothetical protein
MVGIFCHALNGSCLTAPASTGYCGHAVVWLGLVYGLMAWGSGWLAGSWERPGAVGHLAARHGSSKQHQRTSTATAFAWMFLPGLARLCAAVLCGGRSAHCAHIALLSRTHSNTRHSPVVPGYSISPPLASLPDPPAPKSLPFPSPVVLSCIPALPDLVLVLGPVVFCCLPVTRI